MKKVLVLAYNNVGNFGDRLGIHLINSVLPADCCVTYAHFYPWDVPDEEFDLVVVGIGGSLHKPLLTDTLHDFVRMSKKSIGIFGTQYRESISHRLNDLIEELDIWYARYEDDVELYGNESTIHLGDWLIDACPMSTPTLNEVRIGKEIWDDHPLDRTILQIQKYRRVFTGSLHPLLCALTSAKEVSYAEQECGSLKSGKFASMLRDVFGETYPEKEFFEVDSDKVLKYKVMVRQNLENMRIQIKELLNG